MELELTRGTAEESKSDLRSQVKDLQMEVLELQKREIKLMIEKNATLEDKFTLQKQHADALAKVTCLEHQLQSQAKNYEKELNRQSEQFNSQIISATEQVELEKNEELQKVTGSMLELQQKLKDATRVIESMEEEKRQLADQQPVDFSEELQRDAEAAREAYEQLQREHLSCTETMEDLSSENETLNSAVNVHVDAMLKLHRDNESYKKAMETMKKESAASKKREMRHKNTNATLKIQKQDLQNEKKSDRKKIGVLEQEVEKLNAKLEECDDNNTEVLLKLRVVEEERTIIQCLGAGWLWLWGVAAEVVAPVAPQATKTKEHKQELEQVKAQHDAVMEEQQAKHNNELSSLRTEHSAAMERNARIKNSLEIQVLKSEHAAAIAELQTKHTEALEQLRTLHKNTMKKYHDKLREHKGKCSAQPQKLRDDRALQEAEHKAAVEKLEEQLAEERGQRMKVADQATLVAKQNQKWAKHLQKTVDDLTKKHVEELKTKTEIAEKQMEESMKKKFESTRKEFYFENSNLKRQIAELRAQKVNSAATDESNKTTGETSPPVTNQPGSTPEKMSVDLAASNESTPSKESSCRRAVAFVSSQDQAPGPPGPPGPPDPGPPPKRARRDDTENVPSPNNIRMSADCSESTSNRRTTHRAAGERSSTYEFVEDCRRQRPNSQTRGEWRRQDRHESSEHEEEFRHSRRPRQSPPVDPRRVQHQSRLRSQTHTCRNCGRKFVSKKAVVQHVRMTHRRSQSGQRWPKSSAPYHVDDMPAFNSQESTSELPIELEHHFQSSYNGQQRGDHY